MIRFDRRRYIMLPCRHRSRQRVIIATSRRGCEHKEYPFDISAVQLLRITLVSLIALR